MIEGAAVTPLTSFSLCFTGGDRTCVLQTSAEHSMVAGSVRVLWEELKFGCLKATSL